MFLRFLHIFLMGFFILTVTDGRALALLGEGEYSEEEKVGFAFYKLGDIPPNFDMWARNTGSSPGSLPGQKDHNFQNEISRLEYGFHNFRPDEDMVFVRSPVKIVTSDFASPDPAFSELGIQKLSVISMPNMPASYLPFQVINTWVAIVPDDYKSFTHLYLTIEQFEALQKSVNAKTWKGDLRIEGEIELVLRPVSVDSKKPIKINDQEMWLMRAEVGSMTIWSKDKQKVIWEYSAPWYVTGRSEQLLNLYEE